MFFFSIFSFTTMLTFSQEETSVLFIGNSFTFMNNMPFIFKDIAESKGKRMIVDTVVEGGKDFNYHSSRPETYETIKSRKWDYIVIQGHSNELAQPDSKVDKLTFPFAKKIVDSIRENSECTQILLYMTWGYKNGNSGWAPISTYDSMQYRIKNQYLRFADLLNARISPVGEVWKTIRTDYKGINLYDPDNHHPSLEGSYLSACTFFASIFGESPINNGSGALVDVATRQIIEMNASQVVLNNLNQWRFIPKKDQLETGFDLVLMNDTLKLTNRSKNATWLEWDFGNGHISTEEDPSYCYPEKGTYVVSQKITNSCKSSILKREITIK